MGEVGSEAVAGHEPVMTADATRREHGRSPEALRRRTNG